MRRRSARLAVALAGSLIAAPAAAAGPVPSDSRDPAAADGTVELSLGPGSALRGGVEVTWQGPAATPPRTQTTATTRWALAPGAWTVTARSRRFAAARAVEVVAGSPARVTLQLRRTRADRARIGLSAATGGAGLALLLAGIGVGARGGADYRAAAGSLDGTTDAANAAAGAAALAAIKSQSSGAILAASGAGAGIVAATVAADASDRVVAAEIGVGVALTSVGVAWLVTAKQQYLADAPQDVGVWVPDRGFLDEHRRPELAAASLLGLGAGVALAASTVLITRAAVGDRPVRGLALAPWPAARGAGLSLRGRF